MQQPNMMTLVKILNMTFSDNDAEALSAIRKANVIVKQRGGYWDCILKGVAQDQSTSQNNRVFWPDGEKLFQRLRDYGKWDDFSQSVYEQYMRNGKKLTQKQINAIIAKVRR